jgi:hypothetical protein
MKAMMTLSTIFLKKASNVLVFFAVLVVSACQTPPLDPRFPELTYSHLPQFQLDAQTLEITSKYRSPMAPPNVEHRFPVPPSKALRQWAADRLNTSAGEGLARFVILDASVKEVALKTDKGFSGLFKKEQSENYEMKIAASLELLDAQGKRRGIALAEAMRTRTIREDMSLNERKMIWFEITEALMIDFNGEMEKSIKAYLSRWVR